MSRKTPCVCLLAVCLVALAARRHLPSAGQSARHTPPSRAVSSFLAASLSKNATTGSVPRLGQSRAAASLAPPQLMAAGSIRGAANRRGKSFAIPFSFEPNTGQADSQVAFIGRGAGLTVLLKQREIAVQIAGASRVARGRKPGAPRTLSMRLTDAPRLMWQGSEKLRGETNYLIGNDRRRWRTHVPHFAQAVAANAGLGVAVVVYGNDAGVEYDLRVAPEANLARLRVKISGADAMTVADDGDLVLKAGGAQLRMRKPAIYQETGNEPAAREPVDGGYVLARNNTVGFRVARRDPHATLVIDPSLSIGYASFLGGEGTDSAASVGLDGAGKVYVGGTTTSVASFSETGRALGPGGGTSEFFIAKIDPTIAGPNSLVYLTFLGGSQEQSGGLIAVANGGSVAITGATTSPDFPVTDTTRAATAPANDVAVSEVDPTGSTLVFSTLFGGTGVESRNGSGGIALDAAGDVYVSSDTNITPLDLGSTDLPITPTAAPTTAYQVTWDGEDSDAFLAIYTPPAQAGGAAMLKYCSYLGTAATGTVSIGGVAVDSNTSPPTIYIAGTVGNPTIAFPFTNAFQTAYAGGESDAFLMKISPQGRGSVDLVYATLLGGTGDDAALGVAIDSNTPPSAYVTGTTTSKDFPTKALQSPFSAALNPYAAANTFLTVVGQSATGQTSLLYSSYLGGSSTDQGDAVTVAAQNAVYVAGTTSSWDFPWHDNVQPFNGQTVAFVAKFDPTMAGPASLIYATPLGGSSSASDASGAQGNAVAADSGGHVYLVGATSSPDFPTALTSSGQSLSGAQPACASCWASPPLADAFVAELQEEQAPQPALAFAQRYLNFLFSTAAQPTGITNTGDSPLNVSNIAFAGPDGGDFSFLGTAACTSQALSPGASCVFEVGFSPSKAGYETAVIRVTDNAPGSPQQLELLGAAPGLAALPLSLAFPAQSVGSASEPQQVTFTVVNPSGNTLTIDSAPSLGGANPGEFQLAQGTAACMVQAPLASNASCSVNVIFLPLASGPFRSEVDVTFHLNGEGEQALAVPITGTAVSSPGVSAPPSVNFGSQLAGTAGAPQPITIQNSAAGAGAGTLSFTAASMSGANSGDFSITSDSCTSAGTPAGQTCAIQVAFRPAQAAVCGTQSNRTATLALSDNAPGSPQTISLSGTAEDFCFSSPTGQAASAPIQPGQTATYDLDVNSSQGFSGTVGLACSGAPAEASCNLSAPSVSVSPTAAGSFSVNVPTTAPSSSFAPHGKGPARGPRNPSALFALFAGIGALAAASLLKKRLALVRAMQAFALLVALGTGAVACGGGNGASDPPDPGTPAGTYTITVTATVTVSSTTVTRTIPLTLTVN